MRKLWKSGFSFISTSYKIALRTAREGGTHARASRYGKAMRNLKENLGLDPTSPSPGQRVITREAAGMKKLWESYEKAMNKI